MGRFDQAVLAWLQASLASSQLGRGDSHGPIGTCYDYRRVLAWLDIAIKSNRQC